MPTYILNIPSQLPPLTGNSLLYLRVNAGENGVEWAATAGGGITIGTTAIASGTVNRILFEGAGNVVQQDSAFVWNNTDKRLILGTEVVADTNSRLVVIGKNPSGTGTTFAVHNSTGTNNALVVRDDGNIGFGTNSPLQILHLQRNAASVRTNINLENQLTSSSNHNVCGVGINLINETETATISFSKSSAGAGAGGRLEFNSPRGVYFVSGGLYNSRNFTYEYTASAGNNAIFSIGRGATDRASVTLQSSGGGTHNIDFRLIRGATSNGFILRNANSASFDVVEDATSTLLMRLTNIGSFLLGTPTDVASSILTLESTTRGFLPPRMTTAERDAITSPAAGLVIYNTTDNKHQGYDGTNWNNFY